MKAQVLQTPCEELVDERDGTEWECTFGDRHAMVYP